MSKRPQNHADDAEPRLYIGTADGLHILRGDPARSSWSPAGRALSGHDISALARDVRVPETFFAGMAAGALLRSGDGGASWESAGAGLPGHKIWSIVPDP